MFWASTSFTRENSASFLIPLQKRFYRAISAGFTVSTLRKIVCWKCWAHFFSFLFSKTTFLRVYFLLHLWRPSTLHPSLSKRGLSVSVFYYLLKLAKDEKKEELDKKKVKEALAEAEKMQQEDGAFELNYA